MQTMFNREARLQVLLLLVFMFIMAGIVGCEGLTPKKQLVMMYGTYNSQYSSYMTDTGYTLNVSGEWEKTYSPAYTDEEMIIIRKKKKILTRMYPLVKLYDSMVVGTIPFDASIEQSLLNLIDQFSELTKQGGAQ